MIAVQLLAHEGLDGISVNRVPAPEPGPGEVLLEVKAAGVNPVDWKIAGGFAKRWLGHTLPVTLGSDVAGVVCASGPGCEDFAAGDEVFGLLSFTRLGAWAEYCVAAPGDLARKPRNLGFEEAAAMPLVTLTTWQGLFDTAGLTAGQHVLIHGAAGGVGALAVQLAKSRGCRVTGTASARNGDFVLGLGADAFIDYTAGPFEGQARDVDVVYDCVGGDTMRRSYGVLKKGGMLLSIADRPDPATALAHGVRATFIAVHPDGAVLGEIRKLAESGKLKPELARVYPLTDAVAACRQSQTGHTRGKLALVP